MTVQCRAQTKDVYDFLASGAGTKLKVKSADPNTMKVSLKSKVGLLSYGEIVDCSLTTIQHGCRVDLVGRPVLVTNITADVKGTVTKVGDALLGRFGNLSTRSNLRQFHCERFMSFMTRKWNGTELDSLVQSMLKRTIALPDNTYVHAS